ncbi:MAG: pVI protein [Agile wallaby adenovirus 1]|nr:MAG: pVI protein [Agile wallaby atadenovirus 1]
MAFARLAPHCGLTPVYGHTVGVCDMRGGFSWSSLGNSLSSGLRTFGSFLSSTANKIGNSTAFQQAKQGFLNSGIVENAGALAGQTLNSLVDIGRLKVEHDLQRLRDQAINKASTAAANSMNLTQEQLAQLLAANQSPNEILPITTPSVLPSQPSVLPPQPQPEPMIIPYDPITQPQPVPVAVVDETEIPFKRRKRKRVSGWGALLSNMTGDGVRTSTSRYCF